jgi:hypothetical protein
VLVLTLEMTPILLKMTKEEFSLEDNDLQTHLETVVAHCVLLSVIPIEQQHKTASKEVKTLEMTTTRFL